VIISRFTNDLRQRLKQLFAYLGLNQQEVADRFGIERSLISKLYNDKQSISKLFMFALKAEFGANPNGFSAAREKCS
jgi:transcriptional regulator with XRE-family HTH domain